MESASRRRGRGFSVLGLTVILGLIALLAGLLVPGATRSRGGGGAARIVDLFEKAARGAEASYAETGHLPADLQATGAHPSGESALLLDRTDAPRRATGPFDLLGDGRLTAGPASVLVLFGVDEAIARKVDLAIDRGLRGPWHRIGRVQFTGKDLEILVFSPPAKAAEGER
jgi:type II secretory pathway pseudopilin PulG